ncbi:1-phosphofructokinase family hexose kinase [Staphylococcus nepalensis]|uniref:1-phosphofructokinase family hexose kinase n=1 Tax=Staphylococcus nepalensis TaxID=214473 RepID=UPI001A98EFCC|nr:1-phosphofructokinase family hexose kinase [Staphylococcus nepalensis]MBO1217452.1 1-phosphofructokinase family hexose kinase [Staphylococcus nepalensis]
MITTHTFNPSIDITYNVEQLQIGKVHRPFQSIKNAGGKGINVSKVLVQLGADLRAHTYLGGENGQWLERKLNELSIPSIITHIKDSTRQCIAINDGNKQTEILEKGPEVSQEEQNHYLNQLRKNNNYIDTMVISGSTPELQENSSLHHIKEILESTANSYNIVDIRASELIKILQRKLPVHCIKPNEEEFKTLVNESNLNEKKIYTLMKAHSLFEGIDVFLTLGSKGAIVKINESIYKAEIPKIEVENPVGSGDATVAGIAFGRRKFYKENQKIIRLALSCGMSNTAQKATGHINLQQIQAFANNIKVELL